MERQAERREWYSHVKSPPHPSHDPSGLASCAAMCAALTGYTPHTAACARALGR